MALCVVELVPHDGDQDEQAPARTRHHITQTIHASQAIAATIIMPTRTPRTKAPTSPLMMGCRWSHVKAHGRDVSQRRRPVALLDRAPS